MSVQQPSGGYLTYKRKEKIATLLFLLPALIFIAVFSYISFFMTFAMAFYKVDWLNPWQFVGWGNFLKVWNYDLFWKSLGNISRYVIGSVGIGLVLGLFFASLMEQKIRGLGFFRVAFFMPMVISAAATAWIFRLLFGKGFGVVPVALANVTGWISQWHIGAWNFGHYFFGGPFDIDLLGNPKLIMLAVVFMTMWGGIGYWILIYTAGLRSIDPELYESAMIDGAGYWRRTIHITIPLLRHVILFLSITGIIGAFQLFSIIMILPPYGAAAGGPDDATQVPILLIYQIAFSQMDFGYASALVCVIFLILLVATTIQAKLGRITQE